MIKKKESQRIKNEIEPFLHSVNLRLKDFIRTDTPFLKEERQVRSNRLGLVLDDMDVSISEKYRKVMEALFIEAEYGNTIEVYQDKVELNNNELLGNVFRLGRISLFFLSLAQQTPAYFSMAEGNWIPLHTSFASSIHSAIEMGVKRKPVALINLPVGGLSYP